MVDVGKHALDRLDLVAFGQNGKDEVEFILRQYLHMVFRRRNVLGHNVDNCLRLQPKILRQSMNAVFCTHAVPSNFALCSFALRANTHF